MNWTDAHAMCSVEQSYLAIINTQAEADYLVKITEEAPKSKVKGNFLSGAVYLGYHNRDNDGWKTIKGLRIIVNSYSRKYSLDQIKSPFRSESALSKLKCIYSITHFLLVNF